MLTKYDGQSITYDTIGNPTSYYNGTRWTFTWKNGRQLATATNGTNSISYTYDANGLRHSKTVDGVVYTYYYEGGRLMRMTVGTSITMDFFYDQNGQPFAMKYNSTMLYYVLNAQGDVVRIVNASGGSYGVYKYDAWGNILYTTDNQYLNNNPLRYRGYVYDPDSGMYYCQSRYYDPAIGRFLNADAFASTGQGLLGNNMFAYCGNNPVNCLDPSGYVPHSQFVNTYFDGNYTLPYIIDQEGDDVGNKRFGVTTVSHGGCGIIASYNALVSLGNSRSIDEVLAYYNSRIGLTVGLGLMGLLPHEIESYFSSMGYSVVTTNQQSQIDLLSETADACIMYYEFPQTYQLFGVIPLDAYGAHFVEYSRIRDGYLGRNTSEGSNTYAFTSPYNYGTKGSRYYVVGIFIYK